MTSRQLAVGHGTLTLFEQTGLVDLFALEQAGVAGVGHFDFAQHLANDDLDVLVVDLHALQTVDVLHLGDDVVGERLDAQETQDVVRIRRAVDDDLAARDVRTLEHRDVAPLRNQLFVLGTVVGSDDHALLALGLLAEADGAGDLCQNERVFRLAGLEQIGDARQTAGDVAGLRGLLRNTRDHVAHAHRRAVFQIDDGARGQVIHGRDLSAGDVQLLALLIHQLDHGALLFGGRAAVLGIGDHQARETGHFIGGARYGDTLDEIAEAHAARHLGDDRMGMRIPVSHDLARLDAVAVVDAQHGAVRHLVTFAFETGLVQHRQFTRTRHHYVVAARVLDNLHVVQADAALGLDLHRVHCRRPRRRAADVEGAHGELGAGLADRLRRDDAHRLADVDLVAPRQIAAVAHGAHAVTGFAGDGRTHHHVIDTQGLQLIDPALVEQGAGGHGHFAAAGHDHVFGDGTAQHALTQRLDHIAAFDQGHLQDAVAGAAVVLGDHEVLRHVHETAGQVTRVGGLERGVGETFTCAVGRDEVLQHVEAFAEVRGDRRLDDGAVGLGHEAAHTGELTDLGRAAAGTRIGHHIIRVERGLLHFLAVGGLDAIRAELLHHRLGHLGVGVRPDVDDLIVALTVGDETRHILVLDLLHLVLGGGDDAVLARRHHHVVDADRHTRTRGVIKARIHQAVREHHGGLEADAAIADVNETRDGFLGQILIDQVEGQALGQQLGQQRATDGGVPRTTHLTYALALVFEHVLDDAHFDARMQGHHAALVGAMHLGDIGERHTRTLGVDAFARHVIKAQHHVLRRHDDGVAVGGRQHVVGRHHHGARLDLRLQRQWHVHGHLVAVEVGVVCGTHQRMQLDRLAFDQHRREGLDAETMQGRRAVEQHRMFADHLFQDVPHLGALALDQLLRRLDGGGEAAVLQLGEDEGLEQLERQQLGQTALMQTQSRTDHDHRSAGIVDALAEQILTEAALLALDHVGQGFQRTAVGTGDGLAATAVVEQRIYGFLQHALFVAHDDVGRIQVEQALQAIVAVDDAAIEVVQIGSREAAAGERHQRAQLGRQYRQHGHHHPLGTVARLDEGLHQLEALGELLDAGLRAGGHDLVTQAHHFFLQVDAGQQLIHCLGAHAGVELVAIFFNGGKILLVGEQLAALELGHARIDHYEGFEIEHALNVTQGHVEQQAHARGQRFQEPDVGDGARELDVAHAFTAHLGQGHFHAAFLADHAAVLEALVLAAQTLVVLHGPEDLGAEQTVALGLEGAVIDGLRLLYLAEGPGTDLVGRGQADADGIEFFYLALLLQNTQ